MTDRVESYFIACQLSDFVGRQALIDEALSHITLPTASYQAATQDVEEEEEEEDDEGGKRRKADQNKTNCCSSLVRNLLKPCFPSMLKGSVNGGRTVSAVTDKQKRDNTDVGVNKGPYGVDLAVIGVSGFALYVNLKILNTCIFTNISTVINVISASIVNNLKYVKSRH